MSAPGKRSRAGSTPGQSGPDRITCDTASFVAARSRRESFEEYGRGIAGGLLFSLPLLYTMEMWWAGVSVPPSRLIVAVVVTFLLLLAYNRFAGLRESASWAEVAIDSIEELGLGLVLSALILWLLNRIHTGMAPMEILGKIVLEAMIVAVGVSVGTAQLGAQTEDEGAQDESSGGEDTTYLKQSVIALCGAFLIAANVGPTEEILILAIQSSPAKILALAIFSIAISAVIINFSDFRGAGNRILKSNSSQIVRGSITTYAAALVASAGWCWFFGGMGGASLDVVIAQIVTLGFPAALGASAGSLLLQSSSQ